MTDSPLNMNIRERLMRLAQGDESPMVKLVCRDAIAAIDLLNDPDLFWSEYAGGNYAEDSPAELAEDLPIGTVFTAIVARNLGTRYYVVLPDERGGVNCRDATDAERKAYIERKRAEDAAWKERAKKLPRANP